MEGLQKTYFRLKNLRRSKAKGKKMDDANSSYKETETSILISDKRDCKTNNVSKDDEHLFIIINCQSIRKI